MINLENKDTLCVYLFSWRINFFTFITGRFCGLPCFLLLKPYPIFCTSESGKRRNCLHPKVRLPMSFFYWWLITHCLKRR